MAQAEQHRRDFNHELVLSQQALSASDLKLPQTVNQLAAASKSTSNLQTDLQQFQKATGAYLPQTERLMLKQAAHLVTNKLVRLHLMGKDGKPMSPGEATFINLNILKRNKATDQAALTRYLEENPDLEVGLDLLTANWKEPAQLMQLPAFCCRNDSIESSSSVITMDYLRACLDKECPADTFPMRDALDSVLHSLHELSERLGEDLFMSTKARTLGTKHGQSQEKGNAHKGNRLLP